MSEQIAIIAGSANAVLASAVAAELELPLSACTIERFSDGELSVRVEESVRGRDVFLIQATAPPVNDHLVELLLVADACRRAAASRIVAVVPYFGYARSDRRLGRRTPISARAMAELMTCSGIAHVVTLDLHAPQIEGFFHIPVDNLTAVPRLCVELHDVVPNDAVIVSPDLGGVRLAVEYGQRLGMPTAVCHKQRLSGTVVKVAQVIGEVRGRPCVIIDDMITTGGTIAECARALVAAGAQPGFTVAATHGLFVEGAREKLAAAGVREIFATDSVAVEDGGVPPVHRISVAPLLARAIRHLVAHESFADLF